MGRSPALGSRRRFVSEGLCTEGQGLWWGRGVVLGPLAEQQVARAQTSRDGGGARV